jgi:hypothetical protein
MGNEDQDTVALLEKCADVDKRETRLPEAKRYSVASTEVKRWQRYMDKVKKWEDSRLPLAGECMKQTVAATVLTRSSVKGTPRPRISCARGGTRWTNSEDKW